jgi:hypothetical protein
LANCFVLNSAGTNVERVSLAGSYSILNLVYDKTNSTFAGTNLNAIDYFSGINADTLVLTNNLAIAYGGTGLSTTPANGALDIGNGTGFTRTTLTAGTGVTITNSAGGISIAATGSGGTVTSVTGSGNIASSGGTTPNITFTGTLAVGNGGTGAATFTTNNVLLGNGTSAFQVVAPGTAGNVLTSNGTTWASTAPAASGVTQAKATMITFIFGT